MQDSKESRKVVLVGSSEIGKTNLCSVIVGKPFLTDYEPTVFDNYSTTLCNHEHAFVNVALWDTAGVPDQDTLRPLSYPHTDVFLMCFSIVDMESYQELYSKFIPEVRTYSQAPIIIVGLKLDQRSERVVSYDQGEQLAKDSRAIGYFECSSLDQTGLKQLKAKIANSKTQSAGESVKPKPTKSLIIAILVALIIFVIALTIVLVTRSKSAEPHVEPAIVLNEPSNNSSLADHAFLVSNSTDGNCTELV